MIRISLVTEWPSAAGLRHSRGPRLAAIASSIVAEHFHGALKAAEVGHVLWGDQLARIGWSFGGFPTPSFDMTVSKREVGALIVAIGGFVEPHIGPVSLLDGISELGIEQGVLVFVDEDKKFTRWRPQDVR